DPNPLFSTYSLGISTNRDAWVYNYSADKLNANVMRMLAFYDTQVTKFQDARAKADKVLDVADIVDSDPTQISWSRGLRNDVKAGRRFAFQPESIVTGLYRPFTKQKLYFNRDIIEVPGLSSAYFPKPSLANRVICITGVSASRPFSALLTDSMV